MTSTDGSKLRTPLSARLSGTPSSRWTRDLCAKGSGFIPTVSLIFTFRDDKIIRQEAYDCYEPFGDVS